MSELLTPENISRIDKSKMLDILLDFPAQCRQAYQMAKKAKLPSGRRYKNIVFAGVGGSAIGADLVKSYLYSESHIPIEVVREYFLPAYVSDETLVFVLSYSGNTQETLSLYRQAREKEARIIVISSGGELEAQAFKDKVVFIHIPAGLPPRCAIGYLSLIPISILAGMGLAKAPDYSIKRMVKVLEGLKRKRLIPQISRKVNPAKDIACNILGKFPIIYASSIPFAEVAARLRGQLNENAKMLASSQLFPEINHNEIMGWQTVKKSFNGLVVLMLEDKYLDKRIVKSMDITNDFIRRKKVPVYKVCAQGEDLLSRIFSLIYICDFASFYLAILQGIDPTPTEGIAYLKKRLFDN